MATYNSSDFYRVTHDVDVCVVGGGMSGLCAALASARAGAHTILVQDRPVLGGNASSEVRMWICGAHGKNNKETGLLEEIQLDNAHINPSGNYSVWDAVLWSKASHQPHLTLVLNCAICDGGTEPVPGDKTKRRLTHVRGYQTTTQTWHTIGAKVFIDCSGDSVLAPISGAEVRWGRESSKEFGEDIEPSTADNRTMGNTLLIQMRKVDEEVPFTAPSFAHVFESEKDLPHRISGVKANNFWWMELGGLQNTIADAENIRDQLMPVAWGVWDYIKNRSPAREDAAQWAIEFIGSLPGKRENRRYVGDVVMTQNDVRAAGNPDHFSDAVAFGGWSMDDHHPAGLLYPGKPTIFHPAPAPYVIPYRTLYSRSVPNLMMAGRNISVTHAALSSTRVMATCAVIGQASGTAAAMAIAKGIAPAQIYPNHIAELQQTLLADDAWIPGRTRAVDPINHGATCDAAVLQNGVDRPIGEADNAWSGNRNDGPTLSWKSPVNVAAVRLTFDSNLNNDKRMPCSYPQNHKRHSVPATLVRQFRVETRDAGGNWSVAYRTSETADNFQRLAVVPINRETDGVRVVCEDTWGDDTARLFAFEALATDPQKLPAAPTRATWSSVVARANPKDLEPPECERSVEAKKHGHGA